MSVNLHASVCLKIFSFSVSGSGKRQPETLPQHTPPGWKGCVLPAGPQAARQLRDLSLNISDSFLDAEHQVIGNENLVFLCLSVFFSLQIYSNKHDTVLYVCVLIKGTYG